MTRPPPAPTLASLPRDNVGSNHMCKILAGAVPGGAGQLGQQHPLGLRRRLRKTPRQDRHPPPAAGQISTSSTISILSTWCIYYCFCHNTRDLGASSVTNVAVISQIHGCMKKSGKGFILNKKIRQLNSLRSKTTKKGVGMTELVIW